MAMIPAVARYNNWILFCFFHGLAFYLGILSFFAVTFLRVVSRRYLYNGVDNIVKVWLFFSCLGDKLLIDIVQCLGVDSLCQSSMLLCPILENGLKVGADFISFFEHIIGLFVEEKFNTVTDDHEI
jgi:hypothetical protein